MPNYRNVYKSDHLGVVDLEEMIEQNQPLVFTIKEVKQEIGATVAGNKGNFNIAYFVEPIKGLVLNATNANTIRKLGKFGTDVDTWKNILVELYIDNTVKMKGQIVGGVRIKPTSPAPKVVVNPDNAIKILSTSTTLVELQTNWGKLSQGEQALAAVVAKKDQLKATLK